jgi:hypothetical protein
MCFEPDQQCRANAATGVHESSRLVDLIVDLERGAHRPARAFHRTSGARAETHWSRILSYDLDSGDGGWSNPPPSLVDEADPGCNGADRTGRRFVTGAAIVLAVCALVYLAVAGGLHALHAPDGLGVPVPRDIGVPARHGIDVPAPDGSRVPTRPPSALPLLA